VSQKKTFHLTSTPVNGLATSHHDCQSSKEKNKVEEIIIISVKEYRSIDGYLENVGLCIWAVLNVALVGALYILFTAYHLFAVEQTHETHQGSEHYHKNSVGLFLGNTYEDSDHGSENGFTVGFSYERRFIKLLGIGGFYEYAGGDFDKWSIGVPLFIHPYKGLRFQIAPGLEHRESDDEFLFRLGVAYDFNISEQLAIVPEVNVDFVDGEEAFVFGLTLGVGF
jgi:hypothetical protein